MLLRLQLRPARGLSLLPGEKAGDYNQKIISNIEKLDKIEEATIIFMAHNGRRPCPAG